MSVMEDSAMVTAKHHIEKIRKERFWIGVGKNPLSKAICMAVKYLSVELYSKDIHFLMELIQNAEDNEYPVGDETSLEFIITSQDITATGAPATLMIFNNEKGFSHKNMESICNVGDSTKVGNRKHGYIGEKVDNKNRFYAPCPCNSCNRHWRSSAWISCPEEYPMLDL